MKQLLTLPLLMVTMMAAASTVTKSNSDKASLYNAASTEASAVSMVLQLQKENMILKTRVYQLEELQEENESLIRYQQTMHAVHNKIAHYKLEQTIEEIDAKLNYERIMQSLRIK